MQRTHPRRRSRAAHCSQKSSSRLAAGRVYTELHDHRNRAHNHARRGQRVRDRHRPRGPLSAAHAEQDVLPLPGGLRLGRAEHLRVPAVPGHAGHAAGDQQDRGRVDNSDRARAEHDHSRALQVRPQELPVPGLDEGLPDLAVRHAAFGRRLDGCGDGGSGQAADRDHEGSPGGGHGAAAASGERGGRALLAGRREPLGRAVDGDRVGARHALGGRGAHLPGAASADPALSRRFDRRHGEGIVPLRRQHLVAADWVVRVGGQGGDQEHELVPWRPQCAGARGQAAG